MISLRPIAVVVSLLAALLLTVQPRPSTATATSAQRLAASSAADCASEGAHCVFMPWMRNPALAPTLQLLSTLPGEMSAVKTHGSYAYVGQGDTLFTIEVSDPARPNVVGAYRFSDLRVPLIRNIEVHPPLAYVSTFDLSTSCCPVTSLKLVDISQPSSPRLITSAAINGADDIDVVDGRVYSVGVPWVSSTSSLAIYDLVNASRFVSRGTYGTHGSAAVVVHGTIAYLADNHYGLQVVDVSDPDNPGLLTTVPTLGPASDVEIDGSHVYVSTEEGLAIFDISTPHTPILQGSRQIHRFPPDLEVSNGWAYLALEAGRLAILDVRNPDDIEVLATYHAAGYVYDVEVNGSLLYLATDNGLHILRVTPQGQ